VNNDNVRGIQEGKETHAMQAMTGINDPQAT
jgi:hypothetical protein